MLEGSAFGSATDRAGLGSGAGCICPVVLTRGGFGSCFNLFKFDGVRCSLNIIIESLYLNGIFTGSQILISGQIELGNAILVKYQGIGNIDRNGFRQIATGNGNAILVRCVLRIKLCCGVQHVIIDNTQFVSDSVFAGKGVSFEDLIRDSIPNHFHIECVCTLLVSTIVHQCALEVLFGNNRQRGRALC